MPRIDVAGRGPGERRDFTALVFDYEGKQPDLLRDVTPGDVVHACRLLARITDAQWADAFRAAGYDDPTAQRSRRKIRQKIDTGLTVASTPADR